MAETKKQDEPALHATKRNKPDEVEPLDYPKKTLKLDSSVNQTSNPESLDGKSCVGEAKDAEIEAAPDADENGEDDDEDYGSDDDEEEEDDEGANGEADLKGKGIMRDDKGKGKLIVEEEDDDSDDDDDSSDGGGSELDSDLSDDPLAEVDLDNILPSRTRRRQFQPPPPSSGVHIGNDDNDSDDSDA